MKRLLFLVCLLCVFSHSSVFAAFVTKVVITIPEPAVGEKQTFKANVPQTASAEIYEVHWHGELENGKFVKGNDYTISVLLRIKSGGLI